MRAAADSFRARIDAQPFTAAHWYNLGSALYSAGEETGATAAWLKAAQLAPRSRQVRSAMELHPSPDRTTRRLTWTAPITPGEAFLLALTLWIVAWLLIGVRARKRVFVPALVLSLLCAGFGWYVTRQYNRPVALMQSEASGIRVAPYGSARIFRALEPGSAVLVNRIEGQWVLVGRGGEQGWVRREEIVHF
jgi:hypothetical protein